MVKTPYQAWIGSANEELEVILTRTYKNASNVHMQNITFHRAQDGMLFRFDCNLVPSLDAEKKVQQVYMFLGNIQMQSRKIITKALSKEDTFPPNTVVCVLLFSSSYTFSYGAQLTQPNSPSFLLLSR